MIRLREYVHMRVREYLDRSRSIRNALDLIEGNLVPAPIVQPGDGLVQTQASYFPHSFSQILIDRSEEQHLLSGSRVRKQVPSAGPPIR
ncbi:MAG: hypothetical protein JWP08_2752 [Bryobacterales bacterium]|nr:hypothetical protein [Bryobacterales bacterium]